MATIFDPSELEAMKRPQLQKLCKSLGVKANSKVTLINRFQLSQFVKRSLTKQFEKCKRFSLTLYSSTCLEILTFTVILF